MTEVLNDSLVEISDYIKTVNTYFDNGYAFAVQDRTTGMINTIIDGVPNTLFPSDDLGSFFYLRLPDSLGFDTGQLYKQADCGGGIGIKFSMILVACVENADGFLLLQNLITTLGNYGTGNLALTKGLYHNEEITLQELARLKQNDKQAALQKMYESMGMASIHFSMTVPYIYQKVSCIQNPCKC